MEGEPELDAVENAESPQGSAGPDLLGIALRRKWIIVFGAAAGLALGYLYYLQRTPVFQSGAQVLVVRKNPVAVSIQGVEGQMALPNEDYLATHLVLMRSPLIVRRAVEKSQLQSLRSFAAGGDPTGTIATHLTVARESTESGASNILKLSWRGPVAEDCGKVLNAIIESYTDFLGDTYQDVSDRTLTLITEAKEVLKTDLEQKDKEFLEFRLNAPLLWKGKDVALNVHQDRLANIESARSTLLLRRAETEGRLQAIESALKSGGTRAALYAIVSKSSAGTPNSNNLEDQLVPLLIQEQILLEDYGTDHPNVRSVRKRIELTRDFFGRQSEAKNKAEELAGMDNELGKVAPFAESVEQYVQSLRQELEESRIVEESLTGHFEREIESASRLAKFEIEAEKRRKEIERTQQLFDGVIKRLQEIGLVKDYGGFTTKIINPAGPGRQVEPNPTRILSTAAFLGILGGFGLAYFVDIMDKSFRTPEEIRRHLGIPVVGHIPFLKPRPELEVEVGANGKSVDAVLCTYHRPKSRDSEAYRGVRTALYFSTRGEGHKVIQVTSPGSGDGKTTLAANLAVSIAQSGKRTLLIDADFRRPRVHKVFALDSKVGLASVFLGEAEMADATQQTVVPNLWALPCGPHPPNPAELLTSEQFAEALQVLREKFDFVVIDSPPLLVVSDPCAVAPRVDGVILTIRISKNGRPDAERAKEILVTLGAKVVGVVVNAVGDQIGYHYGYGGYGYVSPYGSDGSGENDEGYYQSEDEEEEKTAEVARDAQSAQPRTTTRSDDSKDDESKTDWNETAGRHPKRGTGFLGWFRKARRGSHDPGVRS